MKEDAACRPVRRWRVIAEEASREHDPARMIKLIQELNQALEEQGILERDQTPEQKKSA